MPILTLLFLGLFTCSCTFEDSSPERGQGRNSQPVQGYAAFARALQSGASCADLFKLMDSFRRSFRRDATDIARMIGDLRSVGCFSRSSTRTTQEQSIQDDSPSLSGPTFTVREYRFYRAVIDTPMSVSEEQALRTIGQRYGASPEEVRSAAEKVQETLSRNGWSGTPESEVRRASDWQGEQP